MSESAYSFDKNFVYTILTICKLDSTWVRLFAVCVSKSPFQANIAQITELVGNGHLIMY
jgi:hypothetical protein